MESKKYPLLDKVIVIAGPTASAKTAAASRLAVKINAEVISADSRQVYKYMAVGTAQPEKPDTAIIKHHLVGFLNPDEQYTAGEFARDAQIIIKQLKRKGKNAVICGGTGLYLRALIDGLSPIPKISPEVKSKYNIMLGKYGCGYLYDKLCKIDPETASKVHPNHSSRIIRALEVFEATGKPISQWHKIKPSGNLKFKMFNLQWDKEELCNRIKKRSHKMLKKGMIEEAKILIKKGFNHDLNALKAIGYCLVFDYLNGKIDKQQLLDRLYMLTKQYAKRQITWFRGVKGAVAVKMSPKKSLKSVVDEILKYEI